MYLHLRGQSGHVNKSAPEVYKTILLFFFNNYSHPLGRNEGCQKMKKNISVHFDTSFIEIHWQMPEIWSFQCFADQVLKNDTV